MIRMLFRKIKEKGLIQVIRICWSKVIIFFTILFRGEGVRAAVDEVRRSLNNFSYPKWIRDVESQVRHEDNLSYRPLISIIIPVYNIEDKYLRPCLDSCLNQTYDNIEICLSDDNSPNPSVKKTLKEYESKYGNVHVEYRTENGRISENSNSALALAKGEFIALVDDDDTLEPYSILEMVRYLNDHPDTDFLYSDEDMLSEDGKKRHDPRFKPDWSPDSFMSIMYTCHLCMLRRSLVLEVGGFDKRYDGAQDYDLVMKITEKTDKIGHVPQILYHWREIEGSTAKDMSAKTYLNEATANLKKEALERRGLKGDLVWCDRKGVVQCYPVYHTEDDDLVSIVIPSKDNYKVLERCIESIYTVPAGVTFEVIVVDNGSDDENKAKYTELLEKHGASYFYQPLDFNFSRMCNIGASHAKGNIILFLNDDIEVKGENWLSIMAGQAKLPHVGAVGCKLYYPGGTLIQHCGVVNSAAGPGHAFYKVDDSLVVAYGGRNVLPYNFSVVTGAALMVETSKYKEAGLFDESLAIAYNDVALCFSLLECGYKNVLRPDVALVHHESISRGVDEQNAEKNMRREREMVRLYEVHPEMRGVDHCYNPNLKKDSADFILG